MWKRFLFKRKSFGRFIITSGKHLRLFIFDEH